MTTEAYIDYCLTLSTQVATEPTANPLLDANMAVEILLPSVIREVVRRRAKSNQIKNLVKLHTLNKTGDGFTLPKGVREEYAEFMQVGTSDADLGLFSYIPPYFDFVREAAPIMPIFTVRNGKLYAKKTGATLSTLKLYALTEPQIPQGSDDIKCDESFLDDCLTLTASILRGEVSLAVLGISGEMLGKSKK